MATQQFLKKKRFTYKSITFDENGWVLSKDNKPRPFDITYIEVSRINGTKIIPAWWTGDEWYGRLLKERDVVIRWKRKLEEF